MSKKNKKSNWSPPKNYKDYFYASSDDEFKSKHPVGYFFLVLLGLTALLLPAIVFEFGGGYSILDIQIRSDQLLSRVRLFATP